MTLPSQFSLEEENFYKDIQDLVKKGSQNEKELSLFLERYMDLLARADLDDETFIINFTKAGLIIEASAKVYGTKVDKLWMNLEHVLESLKSKSQGQINKKKPDCEEDVGDDIDIDGMCDELQDGKRKLPNSGRRRKKTGDVLFSSDDFIEIDNFTGLLGKNMNETNNIIESKIKLCEKVPNMFIKNKTKKKKVDVCLNKCLEDKDVIRLRDWIISEQCLLVKEIYTPQPENIIFIANSLDEEELRNSYCNSEPCGNGDNVKFGVMEVEPMPESIKVTSDFKDEKNNNTELRIGMETNVEEPLHGENFNSSDGRNSFLDELHISKESDVAKFPNVIDQPSTGCLMDVDEVFWNSSKFQDVIPSKKRRSGKTNKLPCQLCANKKIHKKKSRKCIEGKKVNCLDSYFTPHVQPTIAEPNFGILPDEELYSVFKLEMKLIEQLGKIDTCKNINEAYHPDESPEEIRNFLGFDGFENYLMKKIPELQEDEISEENLLLDHLEDDNDNYVEDPVPNQEFDLPFPETENNLPSNCIFGANDPELQTNEVLTQSESESEYQKLVIEELKDHYAAKNSFARNKELGIKISKWHEMIADKIKLSQERGALNMNSLAEKIMNAFPSNSNDERPALTFNELVKKQSRRDIPRYFFACLQLTNEGNLDIGKSCSEPLATDCMIVTRLRTTRTNYELEECSNKSPSKELNTSKSIVVPIKRKRTSLSNSSFILDDNVSKKKKSKQKILKTYKRSKNFNSVNDPKRRKCSVSSSDSVTFE